MPSKRMLIDAAHPEETRVVVIDGSRLEEYDVEVASRRQLKGNIYLAKITRVEPSLQAAFVDYGGNRHGFLAFNEIHPDYYQIPVADRERLLAEEAAAVREAESRAAAEDGEDGDGGIDDDDDLERRHLRLPSRHYKIQEVIKRRQIMLVQVAKEERGNKGAALTTYLSLAGRYCVLMPNTARGGGISRKITNAVDRKRLKKILSELEVPEGMAVIVRTAGSGRNKAEIKRDYEYLMRLWTSIRETTLGSTAPSLVYEEGSLIKRSIRDHYERDIEEIIIQGEPEYKIAREFMKLFIPSHAKRVKLYEDFERPLLQAFNVEDQLDSMHQPIVQLRSGGYLVINPTEALVTIDVNSGRSTRERHIEETALRTNLEASDEIGRHLRLRDLAGLIVIDFIDMEVPRNQRLVEARLKDAMKGDRARTQLGRISAFGLLELSRQRMRPSLLETSFEICSHCRGSGVRRSTESTALAVLRKIEEEGGRRRAAEISVAIPPAVATYLLNHKRRSLVTIEDRFDFIVAITADDTLIPPDCRIDRVRPVGVRTEEAVAEPVEEVVVEEPAETVAADREDSNKRSRRRRGRRRRRPEDDAAPTEATTAGDAGLEPMAMDLADEDTADDEDAEADAEADEVVLVDGEEEADAEQPTEPAKKRRRRGKRGGRRRSRRPDERDGALPTSDGQPRAEDAGIESSDDDLAAVGAAGADDDDDDDDIYEAADDDRFGGAWSASDRAEDAPADDDQRADVEDGVYAEAAVAAAADADTTAAGEAAEGEAGTAPVKRPRTRRRSVRSRKAAGADQPVETDALPAEPAAAVGDSAESVADQTNTGFVPDYRDRAVTGGMVQASAPEAEVEAEGVNDAPSPAPIAVQTEPAPEADPEPASEAASEPAAEPEPAPVRQPDEVEVDAVAMVAPPAPIEEPTPLSLAVASLPVATEANSPDSDAPAEEDLRRTEVVHVGEESEDDRNDSRRGWWTRFLS